MRSYPERFQNVNPEMEDVQKQRLLRQITQTTGMRLCADSFRRERRCVNSSTLSMEVSQTAGKECGSYNAPIMIASTTTSAT